MSFASCAWPIWRTDDFTTCFQSDYLQILFPLILISLSLLHLLVQTIYRHVKLKHAHGYDQIPNPRDHTDIPPSEGDCLSTDDEDGLSINANGGGRLALVKTTSRGSIIQADTPPAQDLLVIIEEVAICGLVATNVIALVTNAYDGHGQLAAVVGLVSWVYVLVLATLRLFLGNTKWRIPRLWNHTASIYGFQWLFTLVLFRSVLIRASSRLAQILIIVEFCLTTLLFGIAVNTRKGNKTVVMEWEGNIEPSREPLASVLSLLTFSWIDPMLWQGYKEPLDMKHVWNLLPRDKAAIVLANYRQVKKTTSLALHLTKYFKGLLLIQCAWATMGGLLTFAPTLLLKAILEYVEMPTVAPRNVLWLYVILLPVSDLVRSIADGQALWIGRKICIRIRSIIIGEIYAKALRRKAASGKDAVLGNTDANTKETRLERLKRFLRLKKRTDKKSGGKSGDIAKKDASKGSDEQANLGTIINLMSVDSFKISECTSYLHFLLAAAPSQLIVSIALLYRVMGLSAIPGLVVMVFLLPINILLAKGFNYTQRKIMAATDKRIHTTNEILQNIRIIKYFAWEKRFSDIVDEKRRNELKALRNRYMIWALAVAIWNTVPVLITFFSFLVYTKVEHKPLYPSVAFTAISLFMLLRVPLDQLGDMIAHIQEAKVSVDRVEEFLNEEETEKYEQLGPENIDENGNRVIGFRDASFIWGGKDTIAADGSMAFRLLDLDVDFKIGKLNIIAGPTGSGKTSMLMALLGEMTLTKGKVYLPGGRSREDVRPDPATGLTETCAYVAQSAWLVNANIKENILFSAPYDEKRYKDVLVACALERDLEILDNGDETLVGENGITLSGGQKQRISLARAVYSNSRHVLLDDCLSAVDSHTAKWIFTKCIKGELMKGRTCILVTHNTTLCVPLSEYVVLLDNGRVDTQGPAEEVIASGKLGEEIRTKSRPGSSDVSRVPSRVPSSVGDESDQTLIDNGSNGATNAKSGSNSDKPQRNSPQETKATGAVKWPVISLYLRAMGSWWFWAIAVVVFGGQQFSSVASNLWIKEWANQYTSGLTSMSTSEIQSSVRSSSQLSYSSWLSPAYFTSLTSSVKSMSFITPADYSTADVPEVNVDYYLTVLALIGIAGAILALTRDLWLFFGSLTASWKLHNRLMSAVARAKFKFFDVTPLGQLMNRFSKDLEAIDQEVAPVAIGVMSCAVGIVITVVLIAAITPGFLVAGVFITGLYILVGMFYLRASRDLKRLESVNRSPLFQQFGETLSGVTTIRAYGDERRFIRENLTRINTQARPFIFLWAANRWLAFRTDLLGDFVSFFAGVFVILSLGKIDAGAAGVSLSYAIGFSENILWLVRLYAMNEQNMNSVERVKEYLDVEQEAEAINEKNRPPQNWPAHGAVEFIGYSTRYRKELDPVLKNVTFKIQPREKVGIVGRTGAGKSSLTLAIFRALEAETGKILIDDIDISLIGLQDLREAITIVPQDPTLFTGTIRTNLDPFDLYTDEEVFAALRKVQLIGPNEIIPSAGLLLPSTENSDAQDSQATSPTTPTTTNKNIFLDLSSPVAESGTNLSQGQRQLLCLARAMLRDPKVLVMDEATASIDYATDSKIQETIRDLKSTIITIAHRLATIVDYDKVLVLDHGEVVEYGHPHELLQNENGNFRSMCEMSGDMDTLAKAAKKAWDDKKLVDYE